MPFLENGERRLGRELGNNKETRMQSAGKVGRHSMAKSQKDTEEKEEGKEGRAKGEGKGKGALVPLTQFPFRHYHCFLPPLFLFPLLQL